MTVFAAVVLFVSAVFNVVTWPRFFRRVAQDPRARDATGRPTAFHTVHLALLLIALVIAAASVVVGVAGEAGHDGPRFGPGADQVMHGPMGGHMDGRMGAPLGGPPDGPGPGGPGRG